MKKKSTDLRPLQDLALFADCSASELEQVRRLVTSIRVDAGTVLMREGSIGFELVIIADGQAVVTSDVHGELLATLGAGDFIGEMSLLSGEPRSATVTVTTDAEVLVCTRREFRSILDIAPTIGLRIAETGAARREANRRAA